MEEGLRPGISTGGDRRTWERFRTALAQHRIPFRTQQYFDGWVRRWLKWHEPIPAGADPAHFYAHSLEMAGFPEWRCRQAYQAVKLWIQAQDAHQSTGQEFFDESPRDDLPESITQPGRTHGPDVCLGTPEAAQGRGRGASWQEALARLAGKLKEQNYSSRTTETYLDWVRRLSSNNPALPCDSLEASKAVQNFLRHLAVDRNLSLASIQQARNALAWFVTRILGFELALEEKGDAHHGRRIPTVISPERVRKILNGCKPPWDLFFGLQYGCGLRLSELLDLRVQDIDLDRGSIMIRRAKGDKDRLVPLPMSLRERILAHLVERRSLWQKDRQVGLARVELPGALARKMPEADTSWDWQHVFGSFRPLRHPETGELRRWRPMEQVVRLALRDAALQAGIEGRVHPHLLRHCYATHLLELGTPIKSIQELLGHARLETTMIYMHVRSQGPAARSPLDQMGLT